MPSDKRGEVKPIESIDEAFAAMPTPEEIDQYFFNGTPPRWARYSLEYRYKVKKLAEEGLSARSHVAPSDDRFIMLHSDGTSTPSTTPQKADWLVKWGESLQRACDDKESRKPHPDGFAFWADWRTWEAVAKALACTPSATRESGK